MIPKDVTDLSVEFFSSILECPVAAFTVGSVSFQGNCSVINRVCIDFVGGLTFPPRWLYLKFALPASDGETRNVSFNRQLLLEAGVYRKEVAFYRWNRNSGALKGVVPEVLYAEIEPEGGLDHFLLVMAESGEALNQLKGCSLNVSRLIMQKAAHLHAPFIKNLHPEIPELAVCYAPSHRILAQVINPDFTHSTTPQELLQFAISEFSKKFDDFSAVACAMFASSSHITSLLDEVKSLTDAGVFFQDLDEAFQYSFLAPDRLETLIHGDFRLDNMLLFEDEVRFIDFQAVHFGHPAYDLAQFIVQCHEDSASLLVELVTIYYHTLCELEPRVSQIVSFENLFAAVRCAVIFQVLLLTFHLSNLKVAICPETGKLPDSMDPFMDVLTLITRRGLETYLALKIKNSKNNA